MDRATIVARLRCIEKHDPRDCVYCEAAHFLEIESTEGAVLRHEIKALRDYMRTCDEWAADSWLGKNSVSSNQETP